MIQEYFSLQTSQPYSRRAYQHNQSSGMAGILTPLKPERPQTQNPRSSERKRLIHGKATAEEAYKDVLSQKLCNDCLNKELANIKREQHEADLDVEEEARLRYLEELKHQEDDLQRKKDDILRKQRMDMEEVLREQSAHKPRRGDDEEQNANRIMNSEYEKLREGENMRKSREAKVYRDELRQQIEEKRREAERLKRQDKDNYLTGLDFKDKEPGRSKEAMRDYNRSLQEQIAEKHRKKPNYEYDQEVQNQINSMAEEAEKQRQRDIMDKRASMKGTYDEYIKDKQYKDRQRKNEREREIEDFEREKQLMEKEQEKQKKIEEIGRAHV